MKFNDRFVLVLALLCAAGMLCACGGGDDDSDKPGNGGVENTSDLCSDNLDNDGNGFKDCSDPGCRDFAFCQQTEEGKENTLAACMDDEDNDGDGLKNCDDPDCKAFAICQEGEDENTPEKCRDSKDNDKDGFIDCDDSDCKAFNFCSNSGEQDKTENSPNDCLDGEDNDGDGKTDCCDDGCKVFAFCADMCSEDKTLTESTLEECTDGDDNDKDGAIDCLDMDCRDHQICADLVGVQENTRELCSDKLDNDYNGKADAEDPNCKLFYAAGGQYGEGSLMNCKDKQDNDGDGVMDCDDPECQVYDFCMSGYPTNKPENDECPDDPFKFKRDTCACGETLVGADCYTNIAKPEDFDLMANSNGKFILKQNIDFGETQRTPIANFKGVLDGNNKRISGVFTQAPIQDTSVTYRYHCGLFGATGIDNEKDYIAFRNIDIAITLNCFNDLKQYENGNKIGNLYAGSLSARLLGGAENITGSSKVYVEDIIENNKEYMFDQNAKDNGKVNVQRQIGGLFGHVEDGKLSHIVLTGNVSAYLPMKQNVGDDSETFTVKMGGVAGTCNEIYDIQTDNYMTLKRSLVNRTMAYYYYGGICGEVSWLPANTTDLYFAQNVRSRGIIKYLPMETMKSAQGSAYVGTKGLTDVGGIVGCVVNGGVIRNASFDGRIETNNKKADYYNRSSYDEGLQIGGIVGSMKNTKNDGRATGVDSCKTDASIKAVGVYSKIGGIAGMILKSQFFIRNSSSNLDLELLNVDNNVVDATTYFGGIIGAAAPFSVAQPMNQVYIINNSARTNHIQKANGFKPGTDLPARFGGIAGYGGVIVNNFVSDTLNCEDSCNYMPAAVGGAYIYESYWNMDVTGTESGASHFSDASAEPYTFNLAGIPVTQSNKTILGLLRYNSGHDGGVLSAHIPANLNGIYNNWTTIYDKEGREIPVPADQ